MELYLRSVEFIFLLLPMTTVDVTHSMCDTIPNQQYRRTSLLSVEGPLFWAVDELYLHSSTYSMDWRQSLHILRSQNLWGTESEA